MAVPLLQSRYSVGAPRTIELVAALRIESELAERERAKERAVALLALPRQHRPVNGLMYGARVKRSYSELLSSVPGGFDLRYINTLQLQPHGSPFEAPRRKKLKIHSSSTSDGKPHSVAFADLQKAQRKNRHIGSLPAPATKQLNVPDDEISELSSVDEATKVLPNGRSQYNDRCWHTWYEKLRQYKKQHGDCNVPRSYPPNSTLGRWVYSQRVLQSRGQLSKERFDKLEAEGFVWKVARQKQCWYENYQQLAEFKRLYGHCRVPRKYDENPKLGSWVQTQRTEMKYLKEGKRTSHITEDRIKLLNDLRFEWNVNQKRHKAA